MSAFAGAAKLLLISSNAIGERVEQHRAAIAAAKQGGVKLIAHTSVLRAATSPLGLAREHRETELVLHASGVPFVFVRNGWYAENYTAAIPAALAHKALLGSAGNGRISSAARADYAAAAARVFQRENQAGKIYELVGDSSYELGQFAAELSRQSARNIAYMNMPQQDYINALIGAGLPELVADLLADSNISASAGGLFDEGHQLSVLLGRPTTPLAVSIAAALKHLEK